MESKKKVDEAWKARVKKEKSEKNPTDVSKGAKEIPEGERTESEEPFPEPDFNTFISGLGMQALMLLGDFSHPQTKDKIKPDYQQAKYTIDLIDMLKKKTEGNLTKEEANLIDNLLYDLRMRYLKKVQV